MSREQVDAEREIASLDAIENLLEYAKSDILRPTFLETLEDFQEELIQYRGLCHDALNGIEESSPADGGANNIRSD